MTAWGLLECYNTASLYPATGTLSGAQCSAFSLTQRGNIKDLLKRGHALVTNYSAGPLRHCVSQRRLRPATTTSGNSRGALC